MWRHCHGANFREIEKNEYNQVFRNIVTPSDTSPSLAYVMPAGRPKRSELEKIKTLAWMQGVMNISGMGSAYAVGIAFDAMQEKRFDKYRRGVISPNISTLNLVERRFAGTRRIYAEGPTQRAPLWPAIEGSLEDAWRSVVIYDHRFESMRLIGTDFSARARFLIEERFRVRVQADMMAWQKGLASNAVADFYDDILNQGLPLPFTLDDLAALIGMWRVSMFAGAATMELRYFLMGLYPRVLPTLFEPWAIDASDVIKHLDALERTDVERYYDIAGKPIDPVRWPTGW